ncbi:class I SAM-dependent methyltransferase [Halarcobacter sp.]|uniref:class I SAM-dependent DNA methyltransferase n=1 Tax=Halarcobacter sp. TaxID=2321133 RepID=UPI0029F57975|nr:class I SAM-dependent methyltransferase [Halarcobacter sp.]
MNSFGNIYSEYYDLLYKDKNYENEVEYLQKEIQTELQNTNSILELGCGTGRHAKLFSEKGYSVHGIDSSQDMLKIAKKNTNNNLSFTHADIKNLNLNKEFDVVLSLFHVLSYQNSKEELIKTFEVAKKHLKLGGIFIFDFWYGPAVLTNLPTPRLKKLQNKDIEITRIAEPVLHIEKNIVDVNYNIFIKNKNTQNLIEKKELHSMRYFFDPELEFICELVGFKLKNKYEWLTNKTPNINSWNVMWILKNE